MRWRGLAQRYWQREPPPAAARSRRGIREDHSRRARPHARGGQRRAAEAQFRRLAAALRAGGVLGLLPRRCHGHGAHPRRAHQRHGAPARAPAPTSRSSPRTACRSSSRRSSVTTSSMRTCTRATSSCSLTIRREPRYAAVDFGIVGTLDPQRPAIPGAKISWPCSIAITGAWRTLHLESGWVPPDTRVDEMESAVRTVCEPIFDRPLKDISFGMILLRLFEISRRFNMTVQPQLILLQKTLLNVEGLGRQLYPELDIWNTASPILREWMRERSSPRPPVADLPRAAARAHRARARAAELCYRGALERVRAGTRAHRRRLAGAPRRLARHCIIGRASLHNAHAAALSRRGFREPRPHSVRAAYSLRQCAADPERFGQHPSGWGSFWGRRRSPRPRTPIRSCSCYWAEYLASRWRPPYWSAKTSARADCTRRNAWWERARHFLHYSPRRWLRQAGS